MAGICISNETGVVHSIEDKPQGKTALVEMDPPSGGEEECASCRKCMKRDEHERLLEALIPESDLYSGIEAGMRVEVQIKQQALYMPIFFTLFLPLIGLVTGGSIGFALFSSHRLQDIISAIFAFAGGGLFFGIGYLLQHRSAKQLKTSIMIKKIL